MTTTLTEIPPLKSITQVLRDKPTPPQILRAMPTPEYRAIAAINPSSLAAGLVGTDDCDPNAIKAAWEQPDSPKTPATQDRLDRGTLAHLMVLQPELLMDRVAVWRGGRRASNEWHQFEEENSDKLIIQAKDYAEVATAANVMRSLAPVADLLRGTVAEVAMLGSIPAHTATGHIATKGQVDAVNVATRTIVDLKTTEAGVDRRSVERTIRQFHYREKMAMYRSLIADAAERDSWQCYNVFMSLTPPYGVVVVKFTGMSLEWGESRMLSAIRSVDQCLHSNEWPLYCRELFMGVEPWECDDNDGEEVDFE